MSETILLVEDEEKLARMVELELRYEGYEVEKAFDGRTGLERALSGGFDLVLLDIMLPQLSGMEVLRRLRRERSTPVIMLTARASVIDKVSGLDSGADDYITKPFDIEELLARIRAALRKRTTAPEETLLTAGPLTMNVDKHQVTVKDQPVELTKKEFDLLRHLLENKGHVLSRETLLDSVWAMNVDKHQVTVKDQPVELTKKEFDLLRHLLENKGHVLSRETLLDSVWGFDFVGETNSVDV